MLPDVVAGPLDFFNRAIVHNPVTAVVDVADGDPWFPAQNSQGLEVLFGSTYNSFRCFQIISRIPLRW